MDPPRHTLASARPFAIVGGTLAAVVALALLYQLRLIVLATLIGVGCGVLIAPFISLLKQHLRIPRSISGLVVVVLLLSLTAAIIYGLYAIVADQLGRFVAQWPEIQATLVERLLALRDRLPWIERLDDGLNVGSAVQEIGSWLMRGLATGVAAVAGTAVVFMIGIFTAVNARAYFEGILTAFPQHRRERLRELGHGAARVLRRWFFAHLLVTSVSGAVVAVSFWALGIDYWLLLGVLTALLDFIPYVGAFLTAAAACIVTLGTEPDKLLWVLVIFVVVQQLESDVTLPVVMRGNIQLPEAHLLVFIFVMGVAFGFVGMVVAAPLFAVLHYLYRETWVPRMDARTHPPE